VKTLEFRDGALLLLDQTRLPLSAVIVECRDHHQVCEAIQSLRVRGAPAIGLAAAFGVVLAAQEAAGEDVGRGVYLDAAIEELRATRPTAVNLFWALDRMQALARAQAHLDDASFVAVLLAEAGEMLREDEESNRRMGAFGADLVPEGARILTHCNSGALAVGAYGTALGVIRAAHDQGKRVHVWVDETRPLLQGARLTTWELQQLSIPFTLITDSMAAHFMARGDVDLVMVGADRVVANGDAANKIGTYGVAVLAHAHDIPFYFVAPFSTVDLATPSGDRIVIEQRKSEEVTSFHGHRIAPEGTVVANPAFDVTPARLTTAIITDRGVARAPFGEHLANLAGPAGGDDSPNSVLAGTDRR
jgi:methylthioribose-1-phosphate isomerase